MNGTLMQTEKTNLEKNNGNQENSEEDASTSGVRESREEGLTAWQRRPVIVTLRQRAMVEETPTDYMPEDEKKEKNCALLYMP